MRYQEVMGFIIANHRNPSRHRIEEHDHLNWLKANRKALNAGKMKPDRVEKFNIMATFLKTRFFHISGKAERRN